MPGGHGPAPKDPSKRARRNADPIPHTLIPFEAGERPALPASIEWHEQTYKWWDVWADSPLSDSFTQTDWDYLLDTARLHTMFWNGNASVAAELRLRVAKFGATPEDRARLRIFFADADKKDGDRTTKSDPSRAQGKFGPIRLVD